MAALSPLYTSAALRCTIDLSQLSMVGQPVCFVQSDKAYHDNDELQVAFVYRLGASDAIMYQRGLRIGPPRIGTRASHVLADPSATLLTVGEEMYRIHPEEGMVRNTEMFIIDNGSGEQPVALDNIRKDVDALLAAWKEWKIYEHSR